MASRSSGGRRGSKVSAAGSKKTAAKPVRVQQAGTAAERAKSALDYAARRVPAWQVSVVGVLHRLKPVDDQDRSLTIRALAQVPPEVLRAVELHKTRQAKTTGANDGGT